MNIEQGFMIVDSTFRSRYGKSMNVQAIGERISSLRDVADGLILEL